MSWFGVWLAEENSLTSRTRKKKKKEKNAEAMAHIFCASSLRRERRRRRRRKRDVYVERENFLSSLQPTMPVRASERARAKGNRCDEGSGTAKIMGDVASRVGRFSRARELEGQIRTY